MVATPTEFYFIYFIYLQSDIQNIKEHNYSNECEFACH